MCFALTFLFLFAAVGKPPESVSAVAMGPDAISVSWQEVPSKYVNGYLIGYSVFLSMENATSPILRLVSNSTLSVMFRDLLAETMYSIQVAGKNVYGYGPLSDVVMVKTAKGKMLLFISNLVDIA